MQQRQIVRIGGEIIADRFTKEGVGSESECRMGTVQVIREVFR